MDGRWSIMEKKRYKAVLFDLDGTLTNTLSGMEYCVNHTMDELGLPHVTTEQCREFVGNGAKVLVQKALICVSGSDELLPRAERIYADFFKRNCCEKVTLYPGVREMLQHLNDAGVTLAVVTNKPHEASCIVVDTLIGKDVFAVVRGQIDGQVRKPDAGIITEVTSQLGLSVDDCLFVGDSEVDVLTGVNAKIDTVICEWGFRTREQLLDAGAINIIATTEELFDYILVSE